MSTDFSSIDRLVEFGLGLGLAQQMVSTMNRTMNSMQIAGVNAGTTGQPLGGVCPPVGQWYAAIDGHQAGPLSEIELKKLIERGMITVETLLWEPGMKGWMLAADIPAINKLLLLK